MEPLDSVKIEQTLDTFAEKHPVHDRGLFILAPSGSGKTHFVKQQKELHWIDGDELWIAAGAHPDRSWWTEGIDVIQEVDRRSDQVTKAAKERGLWILGASNFDLVPDAIVIPSEETLREYIRIRETTNYDGGATSDRFGQVLSHIAWMREQYEKMGVPIFSSVHEAVAALTA